MNEDINRKLPFSLIAEQSLLGSILIDPASINEVADMLKAEDFYITEHKQIYLAATELFMTNREIDVVTLIDMLVHKGIYNKSGGEDYIRTLSEVVPTALNVKDYAKIVKEKSALRQLIEVCGEINETAFSEQESAAGIIELAESKIFAIASLFFFFLAASSVSKLLSGTVIFTLAAKIRTAPIKSVDSISCTNLMTSPDS